MRSVADKPSGCASTLAYVVSFVIAVVVWRPSDGDTGVVLFLAVWAGSCVVLLSLPWIWEAIADTARNFRRR